LLRVRGFPVVSLITLTLFLLLSLFAPWMAPYDPIVGNGRSRYMPPAWVQPERHTPSPNESRSPLRAAQQRAVHHESSTYLLGTDHLGRDVWSRLLYGSRRALGFPLVALFCSSFLGATLGGIAGSRGGKLDMWLMRLVHGCLGLPFLVSTWMYRRAPG